MTSKDSNDNKTLGELYEKFVTNYFFPPVQQQLPLTLLPPSSSPLQELLLKDDKEEITPDVKLELPQSKRMR